MVPTYLSAESKRILREHAAKMRADKDALRTEHISLPLDDRRDPDRPLTEQLLQRRRFEDFRSEREALNTIHTKRQEQRLAEEPVNSWLAPFDDQGRTR